jgi:nitrogen fixation/metabolism regulation signal transduction histidine kinase
MALEGALRRITKQHSAGTLTPEYMCEAVNDATGYLRRIETILNKVRKFVASPETEKRPIDLGQIIQECAVYWKAIAPDMKLKLNLNESIEISADAELVRQALDELWENASAVVGPQGLVTVALSKIRDDSRQIPTTARIDFEDTGPGFPRAVLQRAFEPAVSTKAQGTGLGLAFVKKVVELHNGRVRIEQVDPHGAKIIIELPAAPGD